MNVKFKIGIKENLPFSDILEGTWYLCKDTGELYYGDSNNRMLPVNSIVNLYGECDTNSDIQIKTVNINNFILTVGSRLLIKFINTNTVDNPLLNVSETGEKPIYYKGSPISKELLVSGYTYEFVYTGEHYEIIGNFDTIPILSESQGGTGATSLDTITVGKAKELVNEDGKTVCTVETRTESVELPGIDYKITSQDNDIQFQLATNILSTSTHSVRNINFGVGSINTDADGWVQMVQFGQTTENTDNIAMILDNMVSTNTLTTLGISGSDLNTIQISYTKMAGITQSGVRLKASFEIPEGETTPIPNLSLLCAKDATSTNEPYTFTYLDQTQSDARYIQKTAIINDLTTGGITNVLSAEQGKALNTALSNLDASAIKSGTIDIARLPQGALERLYDTEDEISAMSLDVQNGDMIQLLSTNVFYVCVNDTSDEFATKFREFTAGVATSVSWSGVTNKPTTLSGYGITDAMTASAINTALAGKVSSSSEAYVKTGAVSDANAVYQNLHGYGWNVTNSPVTGDVQLLNVTTVFNDYRHAFQILSNKGADLWFRGRSVYNYTEDKKDEGWTEWRSIWHAGNFSKDDTFMNRHLTTTSESAKELTKGGTYANVDNTNWTGILIHFQGYNSLSAVQIKTPGGGSHNTYIRFQSDSKTTGWSDWYTLYTSANLGTATATTAGLMSAADKAKLDAMNTANADTVDGLHLWKGTQTQYNAIATKDANTLYIITEG